MNKLYYFITALLVLSSCAGSRSLADTSEQPLSVRMVESEISRNPTALNLDGAAGKRKWTYTSGLELLSFTDVYDRYGDEKHFDYVRQFADTMIGGQGEIYGYKLSNYNLDMICSGRMLLAVFDKTGDTKYAMATDTLWHQIEGQPRVKEGGFWHKAVYPNQMWLDGLYMCQPFYAAYVQRNADGKALDAYNCYEDIVHQFLLVAEHTYDPQTKLYRHAWDSSHDMFWCDPDTGQSEHAWGRALGWYVMGLVDALDFLPKDVAGRDEMIKIFQGIYAELPRYADPKTGMWYQVLDSPAREGNYQEATASIMFTYAMLKGVRKGYLDSRLEKTAVKLYKQFIDRFVRVEPNGKLTITDCCSVSGLGGTDRRDGTFEYYISEPVVENDCKAVGPFILASLEYELLK